MEQALFTAGLRFQVLGGIELLDRAVVADALAYLRLAVHPEDDTAFLRICNRPTRGIGADHCKWLASIEQDLSLLSMQLGCKLVVRLSWVMPFPAAWPVLRAPAHI